MQWLMFASLGSLIALLLATAGMVRHIWRQRTRLYTLEPAEAVGSAEETYLERHKGGS